MRVSISYEHFFKKTEITLFKRIVGLVLVDNGLVCRTRNFETDYHYTSNFIDTKYFDEISFIDVTPSKSSQSQDLFSKLLDELMKDSQLPVSIGGGIRGIQHVEFYRRIGADRFIINQSDSCSDALASETIQEYGQSSIISSINHWGSQVWIDGSISKITLRERIQQISVNCGSEILVNSVELDGSLRGLDERVFETLSDFPELTFIVSGGVGRVDHIQAAFINENIEAVCTSNIYHLTTNTISQWRKTMSSFNVQVRTI